LGADALAQRLAAHACGPGHVPDARLVAGRGQYARAVGTEGGRVDGCIVRQGNDVLGTLDVPDHRRSVECGRHDELLVAVELHGRQARSLQVLKAHELLAGLRIPDARGAVPRAGQHALAVVIEHRVLHAARMAGQGDDLLERIPGPDVRLL